MNHVGLGRTLLITWLMLSLTSACSGGSASGPAGNDIIDRSGRSIGTITAFGSVIVNDVAFDAGSAIITVDDRPAQESDLAIGQVVVIEGLVNDDGATGQADRIATDPALRGPIEAIDLAASTLTILQTEVLITSATLFDASISPSDLTDLTIGDVLEVYGYSSADAAISATLISRSSDTEREIRGIVSNLDTASSTFTIHGLTIDYAAAVLEGFVSDIDNGDLVEAEGDASGAVLIARRVERESGTLFDAEDENTEVEIEGLVTRFDSTSDFEVNGVAVAATTQTEYEGGAAQDVALNVRLEVEGRIDAAGVLIAREVEFETSNNLEMLAPVEAVNASGGEVTLLGIQCSVDSGTTLLDESDAGIRFFSLQDVMIGDFVKAKAFADTSGVRLTLFKRVNPEDAYKLEGPVTRIEQPSLFISGAQIVTNSQTRFELAETSVTEAEFFSALQNGDQVSASGTSTSPGLLQAEEIEKD